MQLTLAAKSDHCFCYMRRTAHGRGIANRVRGWRAGWAVEVRGKGLRLDAWRPAHIWQTLICGLSWRTKYKRQLQTRISSLLAAEVSAPPARAPQLSPPRAPSQVRWGIEILGGQFRRKRSACGKLGSSNRASQILGGHSGKYFGGAL